MGMAIDMRIDECAHRRQVCAPWTVSIHILMHMFCTHVYSHAFTHHAVPCCICCDVPCRACAVRCNAGPGRAGQCVLCAFLSCVRCDRSGICHASANLRCVACAHCARVPNGRLRARVPCVVHARACGARAWCAGYTRARRA